jgi:hypothetical protein
MIHCSFPYTLKLAMAKKKTSKKTTKKPAAKKEPAKAIKTGTLGTLNLTAVLTNELEYSVKLPLGGVRVEMVLYSALKSQEMETTIAVAAKLVKDFRQVDARLKKYLTQTVVKKINANLRPDDPIRPAEFLAQAELCLVYVHANGKASFWYSSMPVLLDHSLALNGTADGTIEDFDTPG